MNNKKHTKNSWFNRFVLWLNEIMGINKELEKLSEKAMHFNRPCLTQDEAEKLLDERHDMSKDAFYRTRNYGQSNKRTRNHHHSDKSTRNSYYDDSFNSSSCSSTSSSSSDSSSCSSTSSSSSDSSSCSSTSSSSSSYD